MPRIFHVSDTHLGFQGYARTTSEGLNQREVDAYEAFRRVADAAIRDRPDLLLHTGDLFDFPRPNNRAIVFALEQARRLSQAGVPFVVVSGNHDAPRMRETGSILRILEGLPGVHPVYRGEAEVLRFPGVVLHAVPQAITQEAFQAQLAAVRPVAGERNVLAVHGTVLGVEGLFSGEFNEYQIPLSALAPSFDYVALGHFHNVKRVLPNAYYAGSTEAFSFAEAGEPKAFLDVELGADGLRVTPRPTGARAMVDLGAVPAVADAPALARAVEAALAAAPAGAVARLTVDGLDRATSRLVEWDRLRALRADLCHLELRLRFAEEGHALDGSFELLDLAAEFDAFLARYPLPNGDRDRVRAEALACLQEAGGGTGAG